MHTHTQTWPTGLFKLSVLRAEALPAFLFFPSTSAGFSGHLPARMPARSVASGFWRWLPPGAIHHRQLPLSWCIIEPLNQLLPHCHHLPVWNVQGANHSERRRWRGGDKKQKQRETDRGVKVASPLFSYLHMRCPRATGQQRSSAVGP